MKILIVSGFFYPTLEPRAFRTTELSKQLAKDGHEVVVYFPFSDYDYSQFKKENPNVELHFIKGLLSEIPPKNYIGGKIYNALLQFIMYPQILYWFKLKHVLKNESNYDMMISIATPHPVHWGIGRIYRKRKLAKTWVADCGDPFMLCASLKRKRMPYFERFERLWCEKCDYITVPTETSYLGYYPEYRDKIRVIPQGFDFSLLRIPEYKKNQIPTFAYAGAFLPGIRDPKVLFDYLDTLTIPFTFYLFSPGAERHLSNYSQSLKSKIKVMPKIPREELLTFLAGVDFLINIGNGTTMQTPSKLIDYTLTGRPIITIESSDARPKVFNEFLNGDYTHKDKEIDISKYDIRNVANAFVSLYSE